MNPGVIVVCGLRVPDFLAYAAASVGLIAVEAYVEMIGSSGSAVVSKHVAADMLNGVYEIALEDLKFAAAEDCFEAETWAVSAVEIAVKEVVAYVSYFAFLAAYLG